MLQAADNSAEVNALRSQREEDEIRVNSGIKVFKLLSNKIYMSTMLVIAFMYFSVAGLQFWTIQYMQTVL